MPFYNNRQSGNLSSNQNRKGGRGSQRNQRANNSWDENSDSNSKGYAQQPGQRRSTDEESTRNFLSKLTGQSFNTHSKSCLTFSTNPNGIGTPTVSIPRLTKDNLGAVEIPTWIKTFNMLVRATAWDEATALRNLTILSDVNFHHIY